MLNFPIPDLLIKSIYELKPRHLTEMGVTLLLMDLDNTLASYGTPVPSVKLRNWIDNLKKAGIEPFIYSNSRGDKAEKFARALSLGSINRAHKPGAKKLVALLREKGVASNNAAIIGDQIYTDVLCGKRAGIKTIAIKPIDMRNPFFFIRYGAEIPFRYAYKLRGRIAEKKGGSSGKH
ncbi:MAG: YqeG family HAD IIIA-type phosphatase [Oscillospiraceae bacterium]|nr:YqeG family HAD IIIA-type phosphatase [Oscillospiraceae bacterium]